MALDLARVRKQFPSLRRPQERSPAPRTTLCLEKVKRKSRFNAARDLKWQTLG